MKVKVDKRVKLTDEYKKEIVRLRDEGWSWGKLAKKFEVSKRTIDFILHPEKLEENKRLRRERLLNDPHRYYDKDTHSKQMRDLRARKKEENKEVWMHTCRTCGKEFEGIPNRVYCSDKCMWTYWNRKRYEKGDKDEQD